MECDGMKGILGKQMAREDRRQHPDWETFNKMDKQIDSKSPKSPTYPYLLTSATTRNQQDKLKGD